MLSMVDGEHSGSPVTRGGVAEVVRAVVEGSSELC